MVYPYGDFKKTGGPLKTSRYRRYVVDGPPLEETHRNPMPRPPMPTPSHNAIEMMATTLLHT